MTKDIVDISPYTSITEVPGSGESIHISKPEFVVQELKQMITPKKQSKKAKSKRNDQ